MRYWHIGMYYVCNILYINTYTHIKKLKCCSGSVPECHMFHTGINLAVSRQSTVLFKAEVWGQKKTTHSLWLAPASAFEHFVWRKTSLHNWGNSLQWEKCFFLFGEGSNDLTPQSKHWFALKLPWACGLLFKHFTSHVTPVYSCWSDCSSENCVIAVKISIISRSGKLHPVQRCYFESLLIVLWGMLAVTQSLTGKKCCGEFQMIQGHRPNMTGQTLR